LNPKATTKEDLMKSTAKSLKVGLLVLAFAAYAAAASAAMAAQPSKNGRSVKDILAQCELAFSGSVENIEYALSEPTGPDGVRIPHTFVTYRVDEVLAGEAANGWVTLRFVGGLDPETMRYMSSSRTPLFDLGDHDILFVQGNTKKMCPLVGDRKGRLRVIDGQLYSETGRSVLLNKDGSLKYGSRYQLEEVETTTIEGRTFVTQKRGPKTKSLPSKAVKAAELKAMAKKLAKGLKPKKAVVNADPAFAFAGPAGTPSPPPVAEAK